MNYFITILRVQLSHKKAEAENLADCMPSLYTVSLKHEMALKDIP